MRRNRRVKVNAKRKDIIIGRNTSKKYYKKKKQKVMN